MKTAAEFFALWFLASFIAAELWALLCIRRDQRARGSEPVGFRGGGEVDSFKHVEPSK